MRESQVGKYSNYRGILFKRTLIAHIPCKNCYKLVAVYKHAVFVYRETSVRIAVKGYTDMTSFVYYKLGYHFHMCGAAVQVDVYSVGGAVYKKNVCAQSREKFFSGRACRTVRAVDSNPKSRQVYVNGFHNASYIVPLGVFVVGYFAHVCAAAHCRGYFFGIIQNKTLYLLLHIVGKLVSRTGKKLDAVELHAVVGGGYHHARVGSTLLDQKSHRGSRHNAHKHSVSAH